MLRFLAIFATLLLMQFGESAYGYTYTRYGVTAAIAVTILGMYQLVRALGKD